MKSGLAEFEGLLVDADLSFAPLPRRARRTHAPSREHETRRASAPTRLGPLLHLPQILPQNVDFSRFSLAINQINQPSTTMARQTRSSKPAAPAPSSSKTPGRPAKKRKRGTSAADEQPAPKHRRASASDDDDADDDAELTEPEPDGPDLEAEQDEGDDGANDESPSLKQLPEVEYKSVGDVPLGAADAQKLLDVLEMFVPSSTPAMIIHTTSGSIPKVSSTVSSPCQQMQPPRPRQRLNLSHSGHSSKTRPTTLFEPSV
jgi:hypothetical protein